MDDVDAFWAAACGGNADRFGDWMGRVERPIRMSLAPFARAVDAECVVQETLLRMWLLANDPARSLTGERASLRFAIGMARNLARNEARARRREVVVAPDDLVAQEAAPDPPPDPLLRRAIQACLERLPQRPRVALAARLAPGTPASDADLAKRAGMSLNTFLQNIVRARRQLADCLERAGIAPAEVRP